MTRVLVLGAGGMLGHKVVQRLAADHEVTATVRRDPDRPDFSALGAAKVVGGVRADDFATVRPLVKDSGATAVVNCIGVIKQRHGDAVSSIAVNALFPHLLAEACAASGARLIHLSTDCVFSGTRGSYAENDFSDAGDLYGRTKYLGELADRDHVLTLRTSLVGRELSGFHSLLEWFLGAPGPVRGFRTAFFSGVTTNWMADAIAHLLTGPWHGLYQVAGPRIAKLDLLHLFAEAYGRQVEIIADDGLVIDRSLNGDRFAAETGLKPPSWEQMIADMAADPTPYEEWR